jgi:hypothetical protein
MDYLLGWARLNQFPELSLTMASVPRNRSSGGDTNSTPCLLRRS